MKILNKKPWVAFCFAVVMGVMSLFAPLAAAADVVWIDVRTKAEYDQGHVSGALLIPYDQISSKISKLVRDKNQAINLYSDSGRRSEIALKTLEQLGYRNVQNLGAYALVKN